MDSEDVQLLHLFGQVTIINIATLVCQSILYGIYLAIFALTMRCLLRRRPLTTQTLIMIIVLSLLFIATTFSLVTNIIFNVLQIRFTLLENMELALVDRMTLSNQQVIVWSIISGWLSNYGLTAAVTDAVLVWRACVLWPNNRIIKVLLVVLLTITFALSITSGILNTIFLEQTAADGIMTTLPGDLMIAMIASTLLTNITATAMIGVKTYQHRKMMKATHGLRRSKTLVVLTFLAESGVVYCALQAIYAGTQISDNTDLSTLDFATKIYTSIFWIISAMYPSLVFLVIHYNHSLAVHTSVGINSSFERHIPTRGGIDDAGTHVSFAPNAASQLEMGTTATCSHPDEERNLSRSSGGMRYPSEK